MLLAVLSAFVCLSVSATTTPAAPLLHWSACPDVPDTECAGLDVPVDPGRPAGAKLTLRLARVLAAAPAHKKGVLLVIPGGPGAGVSETVGGETRTAQHIEELAQQYDVVTFDPRGIGESSPILCASNAVPPASAPVTSLPSPADFDRIANANAALFGTCFAATGDLMGHLSAMDTAADIERIRQALTPNDGLVAYGALRTARCMARPTWSATATTSRRSCSTPWSTTASTFPSFSRATSSP
jgi:pimeloyl-ACP methyl ester carboxylesterase